MTQMWEVFWRSDAVTVAADNEEDAISAGLQMAGEGEITPKVRHFDAVPRRTGPRPGPLSVAD
jgi:hypothetical protein